MQTSNIPRLLALVCLFMGLLPGFPILHAAPGDLDPLDVPIAGGTILTTVVQPDGKILVGGSFTSVLGEPRNRIARLHADGTLDADFNPNANNTVESIVVQGDGKILLGGFFITLQPDDSAPPVTRRRIARLQADGTLDMAFDPNANREVLSIAVQEDGQILIVGRFGSLQPNGAAAASTRTRIARLHPDGTLEEGFAPSVAGGDIYTLTMQGDGKILVAGDFRSIGSTSRRGSARLNADGTLDTSFNSAVSTVVNSIAVQADGKVLIGGDFFGIARLNPDGARDTGFNPNANGRVYSMAVQADGKILIAGFFTSLRPGNTGAATPRNYIARLHPDGTLDMDFDPNASSNVGCVAMQVDGKILLGGGFASLRPNGAGAPTPRAGFARLLNDPATQNLTVPTMNQVAWTRGGSSPEFTRVTFELSTDDGATWASLGAGVRVGATPGWRIADLSLPSSGRIRARGVTSDGNGSTGGLIEFVANFSGLTPLPKIAVFTGAGTASGDERTNGAGTHLFASTPAGATSAAQTFTIKNTGLADLTGLALTLSGADPGDFTLGTLEATTLAPGATMTFTVAFAPTVMGIRNAVVNLASNDADENPFNIGLQGTGLASNNANLSALGLSEGALEPAFDASTTDYTVSLPNEIGSITVTPVKAEINASIAVRVNGGSYAEVTSGSASDALALNAGPNTVNIRVTAQNGTTTKTYTVTATRAGAVQGSLDPLDINVAGLVGAMAVQPDGKTIIAGSFISVLGEPRNNIARLNADGTLDTGFDPNANQHVSHVVVQPDGKVLVGGSFTTLQPNGSSEATTRNYIARVNADGTLDTGFDPNPNYVVRTMALQPDGKLLVGGSFTTLQPNGASEAVPRKYIARLNADGTLDTGFDPNPNGSVYNVVLQPDGKVLLGGGFSTFQPNGASETTARNRVARVNEDGTLDAGFNPNPNGNINSVVLQPDGKVLLGGEFTALQPNGASEATARNRIARVNADGTLDAGFDPNANHHVYSIALQTDGRVLLGGNFERLSPNGAGTATTRNRIARLNADGTLDIDFDPNAVWGYVNRIALQEDGKVLLAGNFEGLRPNGTTLSTGRKGFARLLNEPATRSLTISGGNRIEWLRGGTSPEVEQVTFELSTDSGASYTPLGAGTRIDGGWEWADPSLPAGQIRARGRTPGGLVEEITSFGIAAAPEIVVTGNGVDIPNDAAAPAFADHTDFGSVSISGVGSTFTRTFTIANTGAADLIPGSVTTSGPNAADFTVSQQPASPVPAGRSTTFTVTFDPSDVGPRSAVVSFSNNDADENPFSFGLQGSGFVSSNAGLSDLVLGAGTLAPAFSTAVTAYSAGVLYGQDWLAVTPAKAEVNATIDVRVNGGSYTEVISGSASDPLALDVGTNTVDIRVTAQDGATIKTYTVTVTRAAAAGPGDIDPLDVKISGDFDFVYATAVQPDGKTIIGGQFGSVLGVPRRNIARLNADGTLDTSFDPNPNDPVYGVAVQPDGKVLLCGWFTTLQPNGAATATTRNYIARVNADGTLDTGFDPNANSYVLSLALQPDGKVLLGGWLYNLRPNGAATATTRRHIARVNADGTLDTGFDPNADSYVYSLAVQPDGKVLLGGRFYSFRPNGATTAILRNRIARVNTDGTLDTGFDPNANDAVNGVVLQADGKVLLHGEFTTLQPNGAATAATRRFIARLDADGTLDTGFDPNPNGSVRCVALQADGKVLLGGGFTTLQPNGASEAATRRFIARLNADETLDTGFDPSANDSVHVITLQADGKVLLGGSFTTFRPNQAGETIFRPLFARLLNDPATQTLSAVDTSRVSWTRGGSSPEVSQVTFELSTDGGGSYTALGNATRVGGTADWQLDGLSLPASGQLRARGRTTGGYRSGSSGLVEAVASFSGLSSPIEIWRQTHFGSPANSGNGADTFDFDKDGLANLIEYAFGLNPTLPDSGQLPQPRRMGVDFTITFTRPAGVDGITYGAEWSENLSTWTPVTDTGTAPEHTFSVPMAGRTALFFRLSVTSP